MRLSLCVQGKGGVSAYRSSVIHCLCYPGATLVGGRLEDVGSIIIIADVDLPVWVQGKGELSMDAIYRAVKTGRVNLTKIPNLVYWDDALTDLCARLTASWAVLDSDVFSIRCCSIS